MISNIGAAAPVISGAIALATGYHAAFLVCAVFAALGVAAYLITEKKFFGTIGYEPDDPLPADRKKSFIVKMIAAIVVAIAVFAVLFISGTLTIGVFSNVISTAAIFIPIVYFVIIITSPKTQKEEKTRVANLIPAFICNCFAMLVWTQSTSILAIFTEQRVDRVIFGMEISAASFQTLPAVFAIFFRGRGRFFVECAREETASGTGKDRHRYDSVGVRTALHDASIHALRSCG